MTLTAKQVLQVEHDAASEAGNVKVTQRLEWLIELVNNGAKMTVDQSGHVISNVKFAKEINIFQLATFINSCHE